MGKDFAQRESSGRQARSRPALPGWVWLLAGVAIGFVIAAGYYISRPTTQTGDVAAEAGDDPSKSKGRKKIAIPPKEPSRFTFYELLPNYEVVIPKESLKPQARNAPPPAAGETATSGERYLIQVGSFQERKEAEQQKANLALLGVESRVEKVTIDDGQTWYRVRIGPENSEQRVQTILTQLEENNIKALVMKVPQ